MTLPPAYPSGSGGGGGPADTDALPEGSTNLYYTDERAEDAIAATLVAGTNISISYNDPANTLTISFTGAPPPADTDALPEGATNLYYTDARARTACGVLNDGTDNTLTLSKAAAGNTATAIFQDASRPHAEIGLFGDDDFHVRVSADGASFKDALTIDNSSGFIGVLAGGNEFPISIDAGATGAVSINGRSINPAAVFAKTTSGRAGFLFSNDNAFLPSGASNFNSTISFQYPFDKGASQSYRVFRISQGSTLADNFWINLGGGIVSGAPTGGDKGAGAINAEAVYDDNSLLSCYVFDQALDGAIDQKKWDGLVPDRRGPDVYRAKVDKNGKDVIDPVAKEQVFEKVADGPILKTRTHGPAKKFAARAGTMTDPLTLDGYAAHWKTKRHLTSMPNETKFDPVNGQLTTGEWIQRLVETVEIQAVLIDKLNQKVKALSAIVNKPAGAGRIGRAG